MSWRDDDEDPACIDCATGSCTLCLEDDPATVGERSCCCGRVDEHDPWALTTDVEDAGYDDPDDQGDAAEPPATPADMAAPDPWTEGTSP